MKIIGRCYDERWRYKIEGLEDNEYWYYEKDFKNMKRKKKNMKRFHYDKETSCGYLIKNNDIDGKPTIKIVFKVEEYDKIRNA